MSATEASTGLDTAAYNAERLRLDAEARDHMKQLAETEVEAGSSAGAWKWKVRQRIWDLLESTNVARNPRPVHHRIPNFEGAEAAANRLASLTEFQQAKVVKVNPDTPQKQVRFAVLSAGKTLLTPQPRLRTGFFSSVERSALPGSANSMATLNEACTSAGVAKYGRPISLDDRWRVDLIVVGSVAVARTGARLGKGEGFAELEYGMLRWMQAVDDATLVVTTVHDSQLVPDDEIPVDRLLEHDVPVDIIVTPTQVIFTDTKIPKPTGILWDKLSPQKLAQIKVLQQLKARIEKEQGIVLPTGPGEQLPPTAQRGGPKGGKGGKGGGGGGGYRGGKGGKGKGQGKGKGKGGHWVPRP
eukprot:EG_transcript_13775